MNLPICVKMTLQFSLVGKVHSSFPQKIRLREDVAQFVEFTEGMNKMRAEELYRWRNSSRIKVLRSVLMAIHVSVAVLAGAVYLPLSSVRRLVRCFSLNSQQRLRQQKEAKNMQALAISFSRHGK